MRNVIIRNVGTIKANCNPKGRVALMNCGRKAAIKIKLLGFSGFLD